MRRNLINLGRQRCDAGFELRDRQRQLRKSDISQDCDRYRDLLRQCGAPRDLQNVRQIQSRIPIGLRGSVILGNEIVRAYGKCSSVVDARAAFEAMDKKNEYSWTSMLTAYVQNGHYRDALALYNKMDVEPNAVVYSTVLGACASIEALSQGKAIHSRIVSTPGLKPDVILENSLLSMYAKCGSVGDAKGVFDSMTTKSVSSWNAMIAAYGQNNRFEEAIRLYEDMDVEPSERTFTSVLSACANLRHLEQGKKVHSLIVARKITPDLSLQNALLSMYARCQCLDEATSIFRSLPRRDVVSWSAMVAAFAETEQFQQAIEFYSRMQLEGVRPNNYTFASVLLACASFGALRSGRAVHDQILGNGYELNLVVTTALVHLYANYGSLDEAKQLFDQVKEKDEALWTAMIGGCAKQGYGLEVLELYRSMKENSGVRANRMIYSSVISACAYIGAFAEGKSVHERIEADGLLSDFVLATSLVNMYCRWGYLDCARQVFDTISWRDTLTWTTLITGYAKHGEQIGALDFFKEMQLEGVEPGELTFTVVLYACSHAGLHVQGKQYFIALQEDYNLEPSLSQYSCMVDLLSRGGRLRDAEELINAMPVEPSDISWTSLLGASRIHKDIQRATQAVKEITKLDPVDPASYILLSNAHAVTGDLAGMFGVRKTMIARGVKKRRGSSSIEVDGEVHEFAVGDDSHPRFQEIFSKLRRLNSSLKDAGYVPEREDVLHDVEDEEKELLLQLHSEKLAIAFGLIATAPGTTLRILNTLRICSDCHSAAKFVSVITQREIIVRDNNRFHKFGNGQCSCGDYW